MALTQNPPAGTGHIGYHTEIHQLLGDMDAWSNASALGGLQAAHDALPAGGGVIYLPPGYITQPTSQVSITKPCAIIGGHGATIQHGGTTGFFDLISVSSAVDGFLCTGVLFDGRYPTRTGGGCSLLLNGCKRAWVTDCRFINSPDGDIVFEGVTDGWAHRNRFFTGNTVGIKGGGQNRTLDISHNRFDTYQNACIFFDNPGTGNSQQDVTVAHNSFRNTQRAGTAGKAAIQTFGNGSSSEEWFRRFKILDNDIQNDTTPSSGSGDLVGIGLDQLSDGLVRGNTVVNTDAGEAIVVNGPRNMICGNRCYNYSAGGISLLSYGGSGNLVKDCVVCCNTLRGNNDTTGQGIAIVATNSAGNSIANLLIVGNRCFENGYGIQSYNNGGTISGSNILIHGNMLTGNLTAATSFVASTNQTTSDNLP